MEQCSQQNLGGAIAVPGAFLEVTDREIFRNTTSGFVPFGPFDGTIPDDTGEWKTTTRPMCVTAKSASCPGVLYGPLRSFKHSGHRTILAGAQPDRPARARRLKATSPGRQAVEITGIAADWAHFPANTPTCTL